MATARRFYLYVVSAFALGLLLLGTQTLLRLLFDRLGMGPSAASSIYEVVASGSSPEREALSGGIALTVVGLLLWLIHWGFTERLVRGDGAEADAERRSTARSVFFGLVLIVLIWNSASSAVDFVREGLATPLGATDPLGLNSVFSASLANSLSIAVAYGVAWAYHARVRTRDTRQSTLVGPAAWISRIYLYGAALIGIATVTAAAWALVGAVGDGAAGTSETLYAGSNAAGLSIYGTTAPTAEPWVRPIVAAAAQLVIWIPVWLGHWFYSNGLCERADATGADERISRVRLTFFALAVLTGVGYAIAGFGQGLGSLLSWFIGVESQPSAGPAWRDIVIPPLAAVLAILVWRWHRSRAIDEGSTFPGDAGLASPVRVIGYFTALAGAAVFTTGLAAFLGDVLQRALVGAPDLVTFGTDWRGPALQAAAIAVAALPIWLWPWLAALRRAAVDHAAEARRTARRTYLYVVLGGTLVSGAGLTAWVGYRLLRALVGIDSPDLGSDLGYAVGALLAVGPVLAYHVLVLREDSAAIDLATRAGVGEDTHLAVPLMTSPVTPIAAALSRAVPPHELVIVGPLGADFESLQAALADRLPAGYSMQIRAVVEPGE